MEADTPPPAVAVEPIEARQTSGTSGNRPGATSMIVVGFVFAVLVAGVAYLLLGTGAQSALVYSKQVHEVVGHPEWLGREVRVEGLLQQGSIRFRERPCEWRFVIERREQSMPVRFSECVVPDTFRDGMGITVTVQGQLGSDGTFVANQVIPRCPSKYEMQQRQRNGEQMPHAATPPGAPAPPPPSPSPEPS